MNTQKRWLLGLFMFASFGACQQVHTSFWDGFGKSVLTSMMGGMTSWYLARYGASNHRYTVGAVMSGVFGLCQLGQGCGMITNSNRSVQCFGVGQVAGAACSLVMVALLFENNVIPNAACLVEPSSV